MKPLNSESFGTANFFHYLEVFFIERYKSIEVDVNGTLEKLWEVFTIGRFHYRMFHCIIIQTFITLRPMRRASWRRREAVWVAAGVRVAAATLSDRERRGFTLVRTDSSSFDTTSSSLWPYTVTHNFIYRAGLNFKFHAFCYVDTYVHT